MSVAGTDLWRMGAVELARAIRSRQVSSREVIEAQLRRIEAVNPSVNAVTILLADQALAAATAADRAVAAGGDLPPLLGIPFTVKGNIDLAGTPTTQGPKMWAEAYSARDAPHVERLRAGGRSRSATLTWPVCGFAGTVSVSCGERPSTPGTPPAPPAPPAAATPRRWPPA